jgi:N-acetylmuramoyl-L-alanine amidase
MALLVWPLAAGAQDLGGLARLDPGASTVTDAGEGVQATLYLSQPVPWRAYALDAPPRVVLDFRTVDFRGADPLAMDQADGITALRFGPVGAGISRMVLDLGAPLAIDTAGMTVDDVTGTATITLDLVPTTAEAFAAAAGVPPGSIPP